MKTTAPTPIIAPLAVLLFCASVGMVQAVPPAPIPEPPPSEYKPVGRNPFLSKIAAFPASDVRAQVIEKEVDPTRGLKLSAIVAAGSVRKALLNNRWLAEGQKTRFVIEGKDFEVELVNVGSDEVTVKFDGKETAVIKPEGAGGTSPQPKK